MKRYKKIITLVLVLAFTASFAVSFSAAEVNNELAKLKLYIREQVIQPETAEENVIFAKTTLIYGDIKANIPQPDMDSAESIAETLCALIAIDDGETELPYNTEELTLALVAMQDSESGAFGSVSDTCKAIIALMAADVEFDIDDAVKFIITNQSDDGSFYEKVAIPVSSVEAYERLESALIMHSTYWAVTALSAYTSKNSDLLESDSLKQQIINEAKKAVNKATEYVKTYVNTEDVSAALPHAVAYAILTLVDAGKAPESDEFGNLMSFILKFANEDGSFRVTMEGEENFDRTVTVLALRALEAISYGASEYKALAVNKGFNKGLNLEGLKPVLIILGVMAILSAGMWIVIFCIKKPKTQTLEEFKESVKKSIPKASEADMDISRPAKEKEEE